MIVIHHQNIDSHYVNKSFSQEVAFVSVLPEDEVSKLKSRENKKAKSEALELLAAARKSSKSVQFANFNDSHECDKSPEEALCTWLSVSCSMVLVLVLYH